MTELRIVDRMIAVSQPQQLIGENKMNRSLKTYCDYCEYSYYYSHFHKCWRLMNFQILADYRFNTIDDLYDFVQNQYKLFKLFS